MTTKVILRFVKEISKKKKNNQQAITMSMPKNFNRFELNLNR